MKIYNTMSREKEELIPLSGKHIGMYTCGPTVYNYPHIGNYRAYLAADILKRYLLYKGYDVKHVMNITDVDDKTIRDSQKEGVSLKVFTERYTDGFMADLESLNVIKPDVFPKATEHIPEMVGMIKRLIEKGIAYKGEDGCIYYSVSKFDDYGKLAHIKIDELMSGARVKQDEYTKETATDFALWKAWDETDGPVFWETEIGKGRPGWHIECSAMSSKYLGNSFDIHTGGVDLIFPHHQNEIAQTEGATGEEPFVKYWVHNEWLLVEGKKMSKSLGNFYTLRDLVSKGHNPLSIRYSLISTNYRQQLNFTFVELDAATASLKRLQDFMLKLGEASGQADSPDVDSLVSNARERFASAMDDDLDTARALAAVFDFMREINKLTLSSADAEKVRRFMLEFDSVFGLRLSDVKKAELDEEIEWLIMQREEARKNKNWAESDRIRDDLKARGIILEDTPQGVRWKRA